MTDEERTHLQVATYLRLQYPNIMFNSDMSGVRLQKSLRQKVAKLRSNSGFPDLCIYEKRCGYASLFIELKRDGEKVFKKDGTIRSNEHLTEQFEVIKRLRDCGFYADFCVGFKEAKELIDNYLNGKL